MKKYLLTCVVSACLAHVALAQFINQGAYVNITPGLVVTAVDGVINTSAGALTVEGTLSTPADLSNSSGATLQGDGQYYVGGDWTNDATFNAGASTVTFDGDQNGTVTSGQAAFYNVVLDKSAADLLLADAMSVGNTLDFQANDNYVVLGDHNLQVADISGYDATRHVRTNGTGFLVRLVGAGPVIFPVGNTSYNPATLANAGTSDRYFLRVADAVLSGGDTGSPLTANAVGRSWFIEEGTPGDSDLDIMLQWNGTDEQVTFDRTNAYVSHFLAGSWDTQPTTSAGGADPYSLSRSGITSLSPFAVFDGDFLPVIDVSGIIRWEHDGISGVKDASVALGGDDTDTDITLLDGSYYLSAANGSNFTITPTKNINKLNGITVADALAIQRHVTLINPIANPYKQVAADVNKSNSISTLDAAIIHQALLGAPAAQTHFKTSWRFVPVSYALPVPPWGFPENISLTGVSGNVPGQDFWGVKTGDVVDTYANPANFGGAGPLVLRTDDQTLTAGEVLSATFRADPFNDLAAWQFALGFDPSRLELVEVTPLDDLLPLTADNFGTYNLADGELRSVWSQEKGQVLNEPTGVFQLQFKTLKSGGLLSEALWLDEEILPAYAYTSNLQESGVSLQFVPQTTGIGGAADPLALHLQVWPNPFVDKTTVAFVLPEACRAQLRVLDAAGRELWRQDKNYPAGLQQETLRLEGATGALVCELTTPRGKQSLTMIGGTP